MTAATDTLPGMTLAPAVETADVEVLLRVLRAGDGWMSANDIALAMFGKVTDTLKRHVRATASAARPAVLSYPGSPGYNLWERCTVEEINHAIEALESQGKDMIQQAHVYRVAYFRRYRGQKVVEQTAELFT